MRKRKGIVEAICKRKLLGNIGERDNGQVDIVCDACGIVRMRDQMLIKTPHCLSERWPELGLRAEAVQMRDHACRIGRSSGGKLHKCLRRRLQRDNLRISPLNYLALGSHAVVEK